MAAAKTPRRRQQTNHAVSLPTGTELCSSALFSVLSRLVKEETARFEYSTNDTPRRAPKVRRRISLGKAAVLQCYSYHAIKSTISCRTSNISLNSAVHQAYHRHTWRVVGIDSDRACYRSLAPNVLIYGSTTLLINNFEIKEGRVPGIAP